MVLSRELMTIMRRAVAYASADRSEFVELPHLRLALLDGEAGGFQLNELVKRKVVHPVLFRGRPQLRDPNSACAPFPVYHSIIIRTPDGMDGKWLDQDSYDVFLEGARIRWMGAYLPKHLAKAYVSAR
jgi:hypothetical protein